MAANAQLEFENDVTVEASPERVFALATDIDRFGEWMPKFVRVEKITEGELRVGTEFREVRRMFGKESTEHFEVTGLEPPTRFDLYVDGTKGTSKKGEFRFTHRFEPARDGQATKLTLEGRITDTGCMGVVFGFLFRNMFRKMIQKDLDALKRWVESQP